MPYINERWLGGMLTNFNTISGRVKKMQEYERMRVAGDFDAMPKKEALILGRELEKLQRNLGGIRNMTRLPEAVFIIDTKKEHIGVTEANKLGIPIVAVVDTNCDPDLIHYVIPGNDDAIRAGTLMCRVIADAVEEGRFIASRRGRPKSVRPRPRGPPPFDPEEEARRAEQQREARRQAALQAQEREARLAGAAPPRRPRRPARPGPDRPTGPTATADGGAAARPGPVGPLRRQRRSRAGPKPRTSAPRPPRLPAEPRRPTPPATQPTDRGAVAGSWQTSPPRTSRRSGTPPEPA